MANKTNNFVNPHYPDDGGVFGPGSILSPEKGYILFGGGIVAVLLFGVVVIGVALGIIMSAILGSGFIIWVLSFMVCMLVAISAAKALFGKDRFIVIPPGSVGVPKFFGNEKNRFLASSGRHFTVKNVLEYEIRSIASKPIDIKMSGMLSKDGAKMATEIGFLAKEYDPFTALRFEKENPDGKKKIITAFADSATRDVLILKNWKESAMEQKAGVKLDLENEILQRMRIEADTEDDPDDTRTVLFPKFGFKVKLAVIQEILPTDTKLLEALNQSPVEERERNAQAYEAQTFLKIKAMLMSGRDEKGNVIGKGLSERDAEEQTQRILKQRTGEKFFNIAGIDIGKIIKQFTK